MLGNLLKRLVNAAVLALAAVTFFLVPMGGKTLFQHAAAVFTSAPAREAGQAVEGAGRRVARAVQTEVRRLLDEPAPAPAPPEKPASGHDPRR